MMFTDMAGFALKMFSLLFSKVHSPQNGGITEPTNVCTLAVSKNTNK